MSYDRLRVNSKIVGKGSKKLKRLNEYMTRR